MDKQTLQLQAEYAGNWRNHITPLKEFSAEAKVGLFDMLYTKCYGVLELVAMDGFMNKDDERYIYQSAMSATLGTEVFKVIAALQAK